MRRARVERWSRLDSALHRRHASAKIVAALAFLLCIATLTAQQLPLCALYFGILIAAAFASRLPVASLLLASLKILPFAACFALISAIAGQPERALMLLIRGYLSCLAAMLLIATTSLPALLTGLEWLHAPRFLVQVMQFLYRYMIVLMAEASAMRDAGIARGAGIRSLQIRSAAGAAAVLFAKSYGRAQAIHNAMTSRGFDGRMPRAWRRRFTASDTAFLTFTLLIVLPPRFL